MSKLLKEIAREVEREAAPAFGDQAGEVGRLVARALGIYYAGCAVRFPSLRTLQALSRNERIRAEFNGANASQLAASYGLSKRRIYQIVGSARSRGRGGTASLMEGSAQPG